MFTKIRIRSLCCTAAAALSGVSCDSSVVTPPLAVDGANLSRAGAQGYGEWALAVSIEATPGTDPGFNTSSLDGCPNISRDGKTFYLASNRPGSFGLDIWVSSRDREGDGWGDPVRLATPVNAPAVAAPGVQVNDFCPSITRDGHLFFFASNRPYADAYGNVPCGGGVEGTGVGDGTGVGVGAAPFTGVLALPPSALAARFNASSRRACASP